MGSGKGFGKTILFGDHFVVYGLKGIPCALGQVTTAQVEKIEPGMGYELIDNRNATAGYKEKKKEEYDNLILRVLEYMGVPDKLKITIAGDLVPASGVGASAAAAASIARAINEEYSMGWNNEQINKAAYEGEKAGSGNPSGIDNSAAVYGGLLIFQKNLEGGENKIETMSIHKPIEIVLANTGVTALTKEVVEDVKKLKDEKPSEINPVFEEYSKLVEEAINALNNYEVEKVGLLMNKNQELLRKITVSSNKVEEIVSTALEAGAIGAKLTGTGRGGSVICLTPGKELQEKVALAIEQKGFAVIKTTVG